MKKPYILGLWDGHDAGAALLKGGEIVFAINEERLSRRKLEVGFPSRSLQACLAYAGLSPADIGAVGASTTDPAKTLTRLFPRLKEEYYLIRRRKMDPRRGDAFKKAFKYRFTELGPNALSRRLSAIWLDRRLAEAGLRDVPVTWVDHHSAHAAAAAYCSGFSDCLVLTLDGLGDGACGSLWTFRDDRLDLVRHLPATRSLGIFFEHVTNLMNMRELEDEGKVMALANYAYPIPDEENALLALIRTEGLSIRTPHSSTALFREMKKVLWRYPSEQFAAMAQRTLEKCALDLVEAALDATGKTRIAAAGGLFSNIKMNGKIAALPRVENLYVFPHMGDGGLALGAAMSVNAGRNGQTRYRLRNLSLGPAFSEEEVLAALKALGAVEAGASGEVGTPAGKSDPGGISADLLYRRIDDPAATAARLILGGEIILWFQGRMEIGPRALGSRSILARPDSRDMKDRLNLVLKKRVWYQPFCPSMLREDAPALLFTEGQHLDDNPFMTMAFRIRPERADLLAGVINVDGTCRPQFVGDELPLYRDLLRRLREELGHGVVLNTSFNIHGEPVVCTPAEALDMLRRTAIRYLVMENILISKLGTEPIFHF